MKPSDFPRFERGDNKRFHVRQFCQDWQVYGQGLIHVCMCYSQGMANMIGDALEAVAELEERESQ